MCAFSELASEAMPLTLLSRIAPRCASCLAAWRAACMAIAQGTGAFAMRKRNCHLQNIKEALPYLCLTTLRRTVSKIMRGGGPAQTFLLSFVLSFLLPSVKSLALLTQTARNAACICQACTSL